MLDLPFYNKKIYPNCLYRISYHQNPLFSYLRTQTSKFFKPWVY